MFMNKLNTNCLFLSAEKEVFTLLKNATISPIFTYSDAIQTNLVFTDILKSI